MTPQDRAGRAADAMWARDAASKRVGLSLVEVAPGRAVMTCTVRDEHLNAHGTCHGGIIFMLADAAFAFASNSHNRVTVAQHNAITYISPGQPGETLRAEAVEQALTGRTGITDVTVRGGDGRLVALLRGASRQIGGTHFPEGTDP